MKLMFASDIHGSAPWCEKMLAAYEREKPRKLCLLGDILYHGPRNDLPEGYAPKEVIRLLNPLKNELLCVCGNCDTEVDQMVLNFPVLQESALVFADELELFLSHGHHHNPRSLPPLGEGAVLINGHTHVPKAELVGGIHCLNCGSVALPKENTRHSYMIYENGVFVWKALDNAENAEFMRYSL
ncbi:MAG: phosphodiesterase [Lachnospiraceae bacterium]|nr:phosphodiesterase [Ruminococcus sp.]MCM1273871.1 phosphodiesterase [Lachnospiraceae bacterium]